MNKGQNVQLKFHTKSYVCSMLHCLLIITFLSVRGVEFGISHWPPKPAGSQWKGRIPSNMLSYNVNQHSSPCFICDHSVRGLRSLYISLFKTQKMIMIKPSLNLLSIFHLCKSKGQIYLLLHRQFFLTFRDLPDVGESREEGNNNCFPNNQQNLGLYTVLSRTVFSSQVFSMKHWDCWQSRSCEESKGQRSQWQGKLQQKGHCHRAGGCNYRYKSRTVILKVHAMSRQQLG